MTKILFVCLGNICRSPTADGIMQHLIDQQGLSEKLASDSAGTSAYHIGEAPDRRSSAEAKKNGVCLDHLRARQVVVSDFERFDLVIAMDRANEESLIEMAPTNARHKIKMLLDYHPTMKGQDVPDPYYGGSKGFAKVYDMCHLSCQELIRSLC